MKRLVIADDHALVLEGLCRILSDGYEIAGTARNGRAVVDLVQQLHPDLVVMDLSMPELNGIEASKRIARCCPDVKIVFTTQQLDANYVRAALDAGASGYVAKQSASTELLEAIKIVLAGRYFVTPLAIPNAGIPLAPSNRESPGDLFGSRLTSRQREVLQLIAEGKASKEIAATLNISIKTVEFHRAAIMAVLGLRTTAELTRYAMMHGIIE